MKKQIKKTSILLDDYLKIISQLAQRCTNAESSIESTIANPLVDTRYLFFGFLREGIQSYLLAEALSKNLLDKEWYNANRLGGMFTGDTTEDNKRMSDRMYHFGEWTKFTLFIRFFTEVEMTLRLVAKNYDGGSCYDYNITTLVNKLVDSLGLNNDYKNLWKIFAYSRNSMHFGGIHTNQTQTIEYKGVEFEFIQDHPINFLGHDNLISLLSEVIEFMSAIFQSPKISAINEIVHSYTDVEFVY